MKPTFNNVLLEIKQKKNTAIIVESNKEASPYHDLVVSATGPEVHKQIKKGQKVLLSPETRGAKREEKGKEVIIVSDTDIISII